MPDNAQKNCLDVQASESGQKLLQFLLRRLTLPQSLLHRWIRTGQIRVNGGRVKPFMHVQTGDIIRMPPFANSMVESAAFEKTPRHESKPQHPATKKHSQSIVKPDLPPIIYSDDNIIVFNKPQGLPVHTGTGHDDSLATRLEKHFSHYAFKPTPAHRLDKDTSGILCVALSYTALRALQKAFELRSVNKEYLAFVHGHWKGNSPQVLEHTLGKKYSGYDEKMRLLEADEQGKEAKSLVQCLMRTKDYSLMHIRLITGRTHQIRVQLAAMGHPILGDGKYGTPQQRTTLCLHSLRITFPQSNEFCALGLNGQSFAVLPSQAPWQGALAVKTLPNLLSE